jgi:Ankyrin repeats (many copies)
MQSPLDSIPSPTPITLILKALTPITDRPSAPTPAAFIASVPSFTGLTFVPSKPYESNKSPPVADVIGDAARLDNPAMMAFAIGLGPKSLRDASWPDLGNMTALTYAVSCRAVECVKHLLRAGADPCLQDARMRTPLHVARMRAYREIEAILVIAMKRRGGVHLKPSPPPIVSAWTHGGESVKARVTAIAPSARSVRFAPSVRAGSFC